MATFVLKENLESVNMTAERFCDMKTYLKSTKRGKLMVLTEPEGGQVLRPCFENAFISTIFMAYSEHRQLVLRPDDVWLAITTAFGLYVNNHAEEMRYKFVDHADKIKLTVKSGESLSNTNWNYMMDCMADLIEKNTKGGVRTWLEPNFSTTTPVMKTVGQVVLMGAMKEYFEYEMMCICGIPKVTLEGTLEDWKKLREKTKQLAKYETECLTHWANLLDPILGKFEESYSGNVDLEFWSRVCHKETWNGYGGPEITLSGWVNVFIPFSKYGKYRLFGTNPEKNDWGSISTRNIPPASVEVPVKIKDVNAEYDTIFYGGHIVCVYDETNDSVRPSLDWAMYDVTKRSTRDMSYDPVKFVYGA